MTSSPLAGTPSGSYEAVTAFAKLPPAEGVNVALACPAPLVALVLDAGANGPVDVHWMLPATIGVPPWSSSTVNVVGEPTVPVAGFGVTLVSENAATAVRLNVTDTAGASWRVAVMVTGPAAVGVTVLIAVPVP